jgi:hypothetical protein
MKKMNSQRRSVRIGEFDEITFEKIKIKKRQPGLTRNRSETRKLNSAETGFKCISCKSWISSARDESGVNHRNHCPLCLVSRHVDLQKAGDRLSVCCSRMLPIGLTFKHTFKRYANERRGELMIIHRCAGCGKINLNRIAADDNPDLLYALGKSSVVFPESLLREMTRQDIRPVDAAGFNAAYAQIFGREPIEVELVRLTEEIANME